MISDAEVNVSMAQAQLIEAIKRLDDLYITVYEEDPL